jgi:hypothetical protein
MSFIGNASLPDASAPTMTTVNDDAVEAASGPASAVGATGGFALELELELQADPQSTRHDEHKSQARMDIRGFPPSDEVDFRGRVEPMKFPSYGIRMS